MKNKLFNRVLSCVVAVLLAISAIPLSVFVADIAGKFVPENLFQTHLATKTEIVFRSWGDFAEDIARFDLSGALDGSVDGDLETQKDVWAYDDSNDTWIGARYELDDLYYCGELKLYSGEAENKDLYRIYASDSLDTLYATSNMVADAFECDGTGNSIAINREVKYVAIIFNNIATTTVDPMTETRAGDSTARVFEYQLWSADDPTKFDPENLFQTHLADKFEIVFRSWGDFAEDVARFDLSGALDGSVDGDLETQKDVWAYDDSNDTWIGARYELDDVYYCGELKLYSGEAENKDLYRIYASDSLDTLYATSNMVADAFECDGSGNSIAINREVKYVAIIFNNIATTTVDPMTETRAGDSTARVFEYQLWTADYPSADEFVSQNLFRTKHLESKNGGIYYTWANGEVVDGNTGTFYVDNRINDSGALEASVDGNAASSKDIWAWDHQNGSENLVLARYHLDDVYYCGELVLIAGDSSKDAYFRVYASDKLEDLYTNSANTVTVDAVCNGSATKVTINRSIKYISIVYDSIATIANYPGEVQDPNSIKDTRVYEFELWTADPDAEYVPENLLQTKFESSEIFAMSATDGSIVESEKFNENGALDIATDGNIDANKPVYDCIDGWEHPIYPGVMYTLSEEAFAGRLTVFATGKISAYASDSLQDLYSAVNCITSQSEVSKTGTTFEVNQKVKYIAVFCVGFSDMAEIQLWSAEDTSGDVDDTEYDTTVAEGGKKVLTIGNSFSENASAYATEIAAAQGYDLLFGYLKYPSCTIEGHIINAQKNTAAYKFEYTSSKGRFTVKDGENTFASVKDALAFTDWDIVVLQQGSTASEKFETYLNIGTLIEYVKGICPDAEIMLHETWSWGIWDGLDDADDSNDHERCYNIIANYVLASELLCDQATVIHSGMAIEAAREYYNDHYKFNDNDGGKYQHLNALGKYIAGATYVATIFGCDINENTYGDGVDTFSELNLPDIRAMIDYVVNEGNDELLEELRPLIDEMYDELFGEPDNFIARHLGTTSGIVQDLGTGAVDPNERFTAAVPSSGNSPTANELAIDGDTITTFSVWGALDWDPPKNVGVRYALDGIYKVDTALIYAGSSSSPVTFDVYAARVGGSALYDEANLVASGVVCSGEKVTVDINAEITEIAFIFTDYDKVGNTAHIAEFDLTGSDVAIPKEEFNWPAVPDGENILKNATPSEIIAPGGDFKGSKEYDYRFMDYQTETDLSKLVDGNTEQHYDIWSLRDGDKPGVLYDLGAYYDITHLHAWAGVFESDMYTVNGYRFYASDSLSTLYLDENLVFVHENEADSTNEAGANVNLKKVRYIAFMISNENGGWKLREFAAYGTKSADQSKPAERESIIAGLDAEYYGVATDNLYDPVYAGASEPVTALVDGKRDNVEFWGGNDVENSTFVFIYNLYANYDLSGIEVFTNADYIDTEFNLHKGVKSAKVYASRTFDNLFSTTPIVLKDGYASADVADEISSYAADARSEWKSARYVAFVFTIGDSKYGACRLEELKVYGTLSAVQDPEPEEVKLPQYIDVEAANGVIARIFALNATDDLSKLDAHLNSDRSTADDKLSFINKALEGYDADALYSMQIVDSNGTVIDTDGRFIRLSIPKEKDSHYVACVDDFGAEIVSSGVLNEFLTVETSTLRSYALVNKTDAGPAAAAPGANGIDWLWAVVIALGVLAGCGVGLSVLFGVKSRKS